MLDNNIFIFTFNLLNIVEYENLFSSLYNIIHNFRKDFVCAHSAFNKAKHIGLKKHKSCKCEAYIHVIVKLVTEFTAKRDKFVKVNNHFIKFLNVQLNNFFYYYYKYLKLNICFIISFVKFSTQLVQ